MRADGDGRLQERHARRKRQHLGAPMFLCGGGCARQIRAARRARQNENITDRNLVDHVLTKELARQDRKTMDVAADLSEFVARACDEQVAAVVTRLFGLHVEEGRNDATKRLALIVDLHRGTERAVIVVTKVERVNRWRAVSDD